MQVAFRCKRSGNVVKFTNENDIAGLRKHEGYEEVKDEAIETIEIEKTTPKEVLKKLGRPAKQRQDFI